MDSRQQAFTSQLNKIIMLYAGCYGRSRDIDKIFTEAYTNFINLWCPEVDETAP